MAKFEIAEYWGDDCTFPDIREKYTINSKNLNTALKRVLKTIKPQIKPHLDIDESNEYKTIITWFPYPSKNKIGYCETIEIIDLAKQKQLLKEVRELKELDKDVLNPWKYEVEKQNQLLKEIRG